MGAGRTGGEGGPKASFTQAILPLLVYRGSVGRQWSPRPADTEPGSIPGKPDPHERLDKLMNQTGRVGGQQG